jgi:hypothetical protein
MQKIRPTNNTDCAVCVPFICIRRSRCGIRGEQSNADTDFSPGLVPVSDHAMLIYLGPYRAATSHCVLQFQSAVNPEPKFISRT